MFVVHMRMSPTDYRALTVGERDAIVKEFNRANRNRGR